MPATKLIANVDLVLSHLGNFPVHWEGHLHKYEDDQPVSYVLLVTTGTPCSESNESLQCCVAEAAPWRHSPPRALKGNKIVVSRILAPTAECIPGLERVSIEGPLVCSQAVARGDEKWSWYNCSTTIDSDKVQGSKSTSIENEYHGEKSVGWS